jgi:hypothetical protein
VEGVQSDERIVRRAEEVCGNRQPLLVDQVVPLVRSAGEKDTAKEHGRSEQERGCSTLAVVQRGNGEVDGSARGEQADADKDGEREDVVRRGRVRHVGATFGEKARLGIVAVASSQEETSDETSQAFHGSTLLLFLGREGTFDVRSHGHAESVPLVAVIVTAPELAPPFAWLATTMV